MVPQKYITGKLLELQGSNMPFNAYSVYLSHAAHVSISFEMDMDCSKRRSSLCLPLT